MKKFLALLLTGVMVLSLAAGGGKKEEAPAETPAETPVEAPAEGGGTIGVCIYKFDDAFMTTYRNALQEILEGKGYTFLEAGVQMVPQNYVTLTSEEDIKNMEKLIDMMEDNDDVQNVYHNWEQE